MAKHPNAFVDGVMNGVSLHIEPTSYLDPFSSHQKIFENRTCRVWQNFLDPRMQSQARILNFALNKWSHNTFRKADQTAQAGLCIC